MGGQLIKGYSIQGEAIGAAGLCKTWKLFKGHKSGAQASASIFLIQKRQLKKGERDEAIRLAKKEAGGLLRVRHPGVLAVIEPLTEDENILAFVTERIEGNLAQLIKQNKVQDFITSELQLKLYLYPFIETVCFIHDNLKQAHLALSFDNVYINAEGKWKIAGFGCNQTIGGDELAPIQEKIAELAFAAPEVALQKMFSKKSDIFAIGVLIVYLLEYLYKTYKPVSITDKNEYEKTMSSFKNVSGLPIIAKSKNPGDLEQLLKNLLQWQPSQRYSLNQLLQSNWINDSTLITVKYLDKINSYENKQQLQFLKGLAGVLDDFEIRVIIKIIVPKLLDLLKFNHLIASIVYIAIDLLKKSKLTQEEFRRTVWPALRAVTQGKEITAQAIYLIVFNFEVLEKFIGQPDTSTHILPLYIKCFECPQKLKHLALSMLQKLSKKVDYQFLKNKILPKLTLLFKDQSMDIRKDALRALYSIIHLVDAQTLSLVVLPGLQAARKMGSDPMINAIINKMYNMMTESLSIEIISSKILPVLIPYLAEPSINKTEFMHFKSTIIRMVEKIQREREKVFQNSPLSHQDKLIDQSDFKFKDDENKAPDEKKGNYNFLANYREFTQTNNIQQTNYNEPSAQTVAKPPQASIPSELKPAYQPNLQFRSNPNQFFTAYTPPVSASFNAYGLSTFQQKRTIEANPNTLKPKPTFQSSNDFTINYDAYENMGFNFAPEPKANQPFHLGNVQKTENQFSLASLGNKQFVRFQGQKDTKKFVGPSSPLKKQPSNEISLDLNYFNSNSLAPPNNSFNLNLNSGNYGASQIRVQAQKPIKPIAKPNFAGMNKKQPSLEFNIGNNLTSNLGNNFGSSFANNIGIIPSISEINPGIGTKNPGISAGNNLGGNILFTQDPFAQVDQDYGIQSKAINQISPSSNKVGTVPEMKLSNPYGLFQSNLDPKLKPVPKNSFQLI